MEKRTVIILIIGALVVTLLVTGLIALFMFGAFTEFEVYSCGSGFYFNRAVDWSYEIKELGVESDENYFYLEDYFVSEELGTEYDIKGNIFKVGSVYLAKKSDYYNPEVFEFDLDTYDSNVIVITPEMSYVEIYSNNPNVTHSLSISIEQRSLPVDITFKDVNIMSEDAIPVLFSAALTDINIKLVGKNTIKAGATSYTVKGLAEKITDGIFSFVEQNFYESIKCVYDEMKFIDDAVDGNHNLLRIASHYAMEVESLYDVFVVNTIDAAISLLGGSTGIEGAKGASAFMVPCGMSIGGTGTLSITGGDGGNGGSASESLLGTADGGNGGEGGAAISCATIVVSQGTKVLANGGKGGMGGEPSKSGFGLFNDSLGQTGAQGKVGEGYLGEIPRRVDE